VRAGNPVVVAVLGALLLAGSVAAEPAAEPGEIEIYDAIPAETTLRLRVGERRQFSIWARGEDLNYQWQIDGGPMGDRHSWAFTPRLTDIGFHLVTVVVDGSAGRVTRTWRINVEVPGPGAPEPAVPTTSLPPPPAVPATSLAPPPPVPTTTLAPRPSTTTERPTTTSSSTTTSTREPTTSSTRAPTTTTTRRTTTSTARPTTTTTARPTTSTVVTTTTAPPPVPTTLARAGTITENDVRALFERYKAAWRHHDIEALEAVGQIATQGQADALKSYFESVEDLEVDVTILTIAISGDEASVKFIRRDHFRDPGGSMVTKESPVIEKSIVRTPGGLRLAPLR
jgi:hypothetical protein